MMKTVTKVQLTQHHPKGVFYKLKPLLVLYLFITIGSHAQIGIGTETPDASAALEVQSNTKGFLPPRMTAAQRTDISNPATGLMVYCTDCNGGELQVYTGSSWVNIIQEAATARVFEEKTFKNYTTAWVDIYTTTATKEETGAAFISFDTYYTMVDSQASGVDKYNARLLVTYNSNEIVSQTYKEEYNNGQGAIRTFTGFDNLDVLANTTEFKSYTGSYTIKFQVRTQNVSTNDEIRFKIGFFKIIGE